MAYDDDGRVYQIRFLTHFISVIDDDAYARVLYYNAFVSLSNRALMNFSIALFSLLQQKIDQKIYSKSIHFNQIKFQMK